MYEVQMPKFGMSMETGEISAWYVKEGGKVQEGQELCEIASDKITNTLESFVNGTIDKIHVEEGVQVGIGTVIATIIED